jgi:hypothetical protein
MAATTIFCIEDIFFSVFQPLAIVFPSLASGALKQHKELFNGSV